MALDAHEAGQEARLEALEYSVHLLWQELAYVKTMVEELKNKA